MTSSRELGPPSPTPKRSPLGPQGNAARSPIDQPWAGETYYGRPQLKPAPFSAVVVGGYVFLAGLSGSSALLGALACATRGQRDDVLPLARRARYISLLAPTLGAALLVYDLHTPQRFYNMLRVAKSTSPMSIGTWLLVGFSGAAGVAGVAQVASDLRPLWRWPEWVAQVASLPAALFGAGLSTYTAALVSATSTPVWAAAPRATAMRFASSSIATATAALSLGEASPRLRRSLGALLFAALATDLCATTAVHRGLHAAGIAGALSGRWYQVERIGAGWLGIMLPLGLLAGKRLFGRRRSGQLEPIASVLAIAGSAAFRMSFLGIGMDSAARPEISLRFAQRDNLPKR